MCVSSALLKTVQVSTHTRTYVQRSSTTCRKDRRIQNAPFRTLMCLMPLIWSQQTHPFRHWSKCSAQAHAGRWLTDYLLKLTAIWHLGEVSIRWCGKNLAQMGLIQSYLSPTLRLSLHAKIFNKVFFVPQGQASVWLQFPVLAPSCVSHLSRWRLWQRRRRGTNTCKQTDL